MSVERASTVRNIEDTYELHEKTNKLLHTTPCCRSHVLAKVCTYFMYKVRYTNSSTEIPEFPIAPEIALELLMAANFLDCWRLTVVCISVIADIMLHLFKFNLFVLWYVNLRLSNFDKDILPKVSITCIVSQECIKDHGSVTCCTLCIVTLLLWGIQNSLFSFPQQKNFLRMLHWKFFSN